MRMVGSQGGLVCVGWGRRYAGETMELAEGIGETNNSLFISILYEHWFPVFQGIRKSVRIQRWFSGRVATGFMGL